MSDETTQQSQQTQQQQAAPAWYGEDADTKAYVESKGWKEGGAAVKSYRELEKKMGHPAESLLVIPKEGDTAAWQAFHTRLGRPEKVDGYDMTGGVKGVKLDEQFAPVAAKIFHDAGLTASQGQAVAKAYNEYAIQTQQKAEADAEAATKAGRAELEAEWRGGFERKFGVAKAAVSALGIPENALSAIESALGYAGTVKLFEGIGAKLGEDKFVSADSRRAGFTEALTPAEAKVEWERKLLDEAFVKALRDRQHPGHKAAVEEQTRLFRVMHPE